MTKTPKNVLLPSRLASVTHLLRVGDVTGIGQDEGAKLVKILNCPPPLVRRSESLKQSPRR